MKSISKRKVINILPYSLSNTDSKYSIEKRKPDILPYEVGWHSKLAKQILKQSINYDIECWGVSKELNEIKIYKENDMIYRIFPSIYNPLIGEISIPLIRELYNISMNQNILIHIHGLFNYNFYFIPILLNKNPIIVQHHGELSLLQDSFYNSKNAKIKSLAKLILYLFKHDWLLERIATKKIDKILVLNEDARKYLLGITDPHKIEKMTMGIDFDLFKKADKGHAKDILNLERGVKYILYSGAFVKRKDIDLLIQAFSLIRRDYPNCILLLKGGGYYKKNLELKIKSLGLEGYIIFIPWVEKSMLPLYYSASNICVLPSLYEGLGVVGLEALACETPFIGTNRGGIPDIVKNFRAGILIPPQNLEDLVKGIRFYLDNDGVFEVDRENAKQYYSWYNVARKNIDIYDELWTKYYD